MSCPPDALNSGLDLIVLPPGGSFETAWVIRRLGRRPGWQDGPVQPSGGAP